MRAGLDITEVEMSTKIRAKYLRALENEEWGVLPGRTYVRSFLRTYAEELGLDARLLVEEYRRAHEGYTDLELAPIAPNLNRDRRREPRAPIALGRGAIIGLSIVGIVIVLAVIGFLSGGNGSSPTAPVSSTPGSSALSNPAHSKRGRHRAAPAAVRREASLKLAPTAPVWICLEDDQQRKLIPGVVTSPGDTSVAKAFHAKYLTMTLGNGNLTMQVNGKQVDVPQLAQPIGYRVTPKGRSELAMGQRPTCG